MLGKITISLDLLLLLYCY